MAALIGGSAWFYLSPDPNEAYYEGVVLRSDVDYVSTRRWKPLGLQWLATGAGGIAFSNARAPSARHGDMWSCLCTALGLRNRS